MTTSTKPRTSIHPLAIALLTCLFLLGSAAGAGITYYKMTKTPEQVISLLITDGKTSQAFSGIDVHEGESIADILARVNKEVPINLSFAGTGADRSITSLLSRKSSEGGHWTFYTSNQIPNRTISRYYPKALEVIDIIWNEQ